MCGLREEVRDSESYRVMIRHGGLLDTGNVGGGLIKYLEFISNVPGKLVNEVTYDMHT